STVMAGSRCDPAPLPAPPSWQARGAAHQSMASFWFDHMRGHHGAGVVDEPHRQLGRLDDHLAEIEDTATRKQRARVEGHVEGSRPGEGWRRGPGHELVERPRRRRLVPDHLGVMDVSGNEDEISDVLLAEMVEDRIALGDEPGAVLRQSEGRDAG